LNRIDFYPSGAIEVKRILTEPHRLVELEQHLVLFFTGFSRIASDVAHEQIKETPSRSRELRAMLEMVAEGESILANPRRPISEFGKLLNESWQIRKTLTQRISNARIDEIYDAGRSAGALGGKLLGAGGGGFMLFLVPPEHRDVLRAALKGLLCVPFSLSNRGSDVVVYEAEQAYDKSLATDRSEIYAQRS